MKLYFIHFTMKNQPGSVWLQELSWEAVDEYLSAEANASILVPIGSIEQHGPHLPLGVDSFQAIDLAEEIAEQSGILTTPPLWFGDANYHMAYPGTISLSTETIVSLLGDVYESLCTHGFQNIITINGHRVGNLSAIDTASRKAREEHPDIHFATIDPLRIAAEEHRDNREGKQGYGLHGGEFETSFLLFKRPELVEMDKAVKVVEESGSQYQSIVLVDLENTVMEADSSHDASTDEPGHKGDPTLASAEKGEMIYNIIVDNSVEYISTLQNRE
jgi:creatinine amidohydrolase